MPPKLEDILPYVNDRAAALEKFDVSEKTLIRWLQHYGLYKPIRNCGPHRLNMEQAKKIRKAHKEGQSMKSLAEEYGVTFTTISRVVHNITYREFKPSAIVSVVYNPNPQSSGYAGGGLQAARFPSGDRPR